ncbi:Probably colicin V production protein [gamma proteobacterium HdN1]|nr:Probably colicin V production protein [gamma proteobacterium HdN1]
MTTADYTILGIIAFSLFLSLRRGFVTEAFSLASWIAAFVVAKMFSHPLSLLLEPHISASSLRMPAAYGALFFATLFIGGLIAKLSRELLKAAGLTLADRVLGLAFGAARGALIVIVTLGLLARMTEMPKDAWWQESVLIPQLMKFETWATQLGTDAWREVNQFTSANHKAFEHVIS